MPATSGNEEAVARLVAWVEESWATMVAVVRKQGWGRDDARDMAQEAVLKALDIARRDPERLGAVRNHRSWLCGIAWNMGRSALAKLQRREKILRKNGRRVLEELHPEAGRDRHPEALTRDLLQALEELGSPRQAEIVCLILTEHLTDGELAESLKITVGTVRWHRNEAIRALRRRFREGERGSLTSHSAESGSSTGAAGIGAGPPSNR